MPSSARPVRETCRRNTQLPISVLAARRERGAATRFRLRLRASDGLSPRSALHRLDRRATNANLSARGFCIKYLHGLSASYSQPCSQNLWICRGHRRAGVIQSDKRAGLRGAAHCFGRLTAIRACPSAATAGLVCMLGDRYTGSLWRASAPCKVQPVTKGWSGTKRAL